MQPGTEKEGYGEKEERLFHGTVINGLVEISILVTTYQFYPTYRGPTMKFNP